LRKLQNGKDLFDLLDFFYVPNAAPNPFHRHLVYIELGKNCFYKLENN